MKPYYQDDLVTIYHGSCTSSFTRREMAELDFQCIVTDPPYGIGWTGTSPSRRNWCVRARFAIEGDDQPFDPAWIVEKDVPTVLFGANHFADQLPTSSSWLVWDKKPSGVAGGDMGDGELAWTNLGGALRIFRYLWIGGGALAKENGIPAGRGKSVGHHPTQKPVALMRWVIEKTTGTVLDPYMGSGSTLVAAKSLNRRAIGIELEERYCEIAAKRCSQEVLELEITATSQGVLLG
jgi:site-specific DNA-methyltransferase (adenine-specific)